MNLEFFNHLNKNKEHEEQTEKFINELENFLEKKDEIQESRQVSLISKNKIRNQQSVIIQQYADKENATLYYVNNQLENGKYRIEKYSNNKRENLQIEKEELPSDIEINTVMQMKDGKYQIDQELTEKIAQDIKKCTKQILDEQDKKLEEYRQEGHSYKITENRNNRVFIWDITTMPSIEIEAVDFPKELKEKVTEGTIVIYKNGKYEMKE